MASQAKSNQESLRTMRHSCSHLLAAAVIELYPDVKFGIGPAIDDGFYYDFLFKKPISENDLPQIEKKMAELKKKNLQLNQKEVTPDEAKKNFKNQPFKLELIKDLEKEKKAKKVGLYELGKFVDLCQGPHLPNIAQIGAYKLLLIAGAYWKGSEKNPMLTRIYGTCFPTQKELDGYLRLQEEAKQRDHRELGKELDLFSFHDQGPGFPFWHPKGTIVFNQIVKFWRQEHHKRGYVEIKTPLILNKNLWVKSGHWDHYRENMYFLKIDDQDYAVKPMNCPGGALVYKTKIHSYRDLPLEVGELGLVHRHELSGVLHGLFRVRAFTQDDAHLYCTPEQAIEEITEVLDLVEVIYGAFGLKDYQIELSTQPKKFMGSQEMWNKAIDFLKQALEIKKLDYQINPGDGAFYGPKIDFHIKDCLGRTWQCGTIQLDFAMPEAFDLAYVGSDGKAHRPVMIHRTILGALERFIGILIEHYAGAFPTWLAPVQGVIIPITDKQLDYAQKVLQELEKENLRVELDDRSETTSYKIREAQLQKVPYMLVVGEREIKEKKIAVRSRDGKDLGPMSLKKFLDRIKKEIAEKK